MRTSTKTRDQDEKHLGGLVSAGGLLIVVGVVMTVFNVWLGLGIALLGFLVSGGFEKGKWY